MRFEKKHAALAVEARNEAERARSDVTTLVGMLSEARAELAKWEAVLGLFPEPKSNGAKPAAEKVLPARVEAQPWPKPQALAQEAPTLADRIADHGTRLVFLGVDMDVGRTKRTFVKYRRSASVWILAGALSAVHKSGVNAPHAVSWFQKHIPASFNRYNKRRTAWNAAINTTLGNHVVGSHHRSGALHPVLFERFVGQDSPLWLYRLRPEVAKAVGVKAQD